ncbi:hypothetical protein Zmor_006228 [Zophobas morio]|uniref:Uncharacterized protein n=1 Tax=Zophobas morio TaxID=2755281 RepID=A0AA38IVR4_9CUCU|nr:hypothetical protein Zmor_006228 [Zophobas morio]
MAFSERHKIFMFRQTLNVSLKNFQENGSVTRKPGSGRPKKRTPELIEEAREVMEETPENVANAVRRRARLCLQERGSHFQHLL